jgi:ABC-type transporter Mla maintaining outer membrane lipid asymmetry ATPase subunit MlaF
MPVIEMRDAQVSHPRMPSVSLLGGVDWTVRSGEFWVVAGLQGTGKTVLLETAVGLHPHTAGTVLLFGRAVYGGRDHDDDLPATRRRMGMVFEGAGRLFPNLTVLENIVLPWCYHENRTPEEALKFLAPLFAALAIEDILDHPPSRLGQAWARRAALARALALGPELLLLDNPLSGLDAPHLRWWRGFLAQAARGHPALGRALTLVVATDELRPLLSLGHRFALAHGHGWRVLGTADDVLAARDEPGVRELLGDND